MNRTGFVLKQVRARPLRSSLTVAAFALSVGLLGFLLVLNDALQKDWSQYQGQRVIVTAKASMFDRLPIAYLSRIEGTPGVKSVAAFDFILAFWKDSRPENQVPLGASGVDELLDHLAGGVKQARADPGRAGIPARPAVGVQAMAVVVAVGDSCRGCRRLGRGQGGRSR